MHNQSHTVVAVSAALLSAACLPINQYPVISPSYAGDKKPPLAKSEGAPQPQFQYGCNNIQCEQENFDWERAKKIHTIDAYDSYIKKWNPARYTAEAVQAIQQIDPKRGPASEKINHLFERGASVEVGGVYCGMPSLPFGYAALMDLAVSDPARAIKENPLHCTPTLDIPGLAVCAGCAYSEQPKQASYLYPVDKDWHAVVLQDYVYYKYLNGGTTIVYIAIVPKANFSPKR